MILLNCSYLPMKPHVCYSDLESVESKTDVDMKNVICSGCSDDIKQKKMSNTRKNMRESIINNVSKSITAKEQ